MVNKVENYVLNQDDFHRLAQQLGLDLESINLTSEILAKEFQQLKVAEAASRESLKRVLPNLELSSSNLLESTRKKIIDANFWNSVEASRKIDQATSSMKLLLAKQISGGSFKEMNKRFQEIGLSTGRADVASRLLDHLTVYDKFVKTTFEQIGQSKSNKDIRALEASICLAEVQMIATTDAISSIAAVPEDDEAVSPSRSLRLLDVQQHELLAAAETDNEEDDTSLIERSSTAKVAEIAKSVLGCVIQCNEVAKLSGESEIFKPTTKLLEVFNDFGWLLPQDKKTFAEFVDCLYFLFYEGAGKDNLRFLGDGLLQNNECDFVWCIKHLRNKWLRHDADHGQDSNVRRSWKELSEKFRWLGLNHPPIKEEHFRYLHGRLLEESLSFLLKIRDKLIEG